MPAASDRDSPQTVMAERVTRVETKLEGLKEDTANIRMTIHGIHGEMQKFVIELRGLSEMKPRLLAALTAEEKRKGAWGIALIAGSALVGVATVTMALITAVVMLIRGKFGL